MIKKENTKVQISMKTSNFHEKNPNFPWKTINVYGFDINFHGMYLKSRVLSKMSTF